MEGRRQTLESKGMSEYAQAIVCIVLFSLLMGVWTYLWVPIPIF
jgi:cbb3-type cytochrome oxidase subunit 3